MNHLSTVFIFLIGLFVSTIIIYFVTSLFGEKRGIGKALVTSLIGTIVYSVSYYFIGMGWIAAIVGGIVWLIALGSLYKIGFVKSVVVAVVIWICATIVGVLLPTTTGPL